MIPYGTSDLAEYSLQCVAFVDGRSKRVIRVYAVDRQGCRLHVGAFKRLDMIANGLSPQECAVLLGIDQDSGNFEQRVSLAIEATGFHVDDDGQETAESVCN